MKKRNYQTPQIVSIKVNSAPLLEGSNGIDIIDEKGGETQHSKVWDFADSEE